MSCRVMSNEVAENLLCSLFFVQQIMILSGSGVKCGLKFLKLFWKSFGNHLGLKLKFYAFC